MDKKNSRNKALEFVRKFRNEQALKYFGVVFIFSFLALFFLLIPFRPMQYNINSYLAESLVESNVNNKVGSAKQSRFEYDESRTKLILYTIYYDKQNQDGTLIQKAITINLFSESYIPLVFLLALFAATPIRSKELLLRAFIGLCILEIYLMLKVSALCFDNYSFPEFELVKIEGFIGGIVFYYNKLIKSAGNGINFLIVAFIWLFASGTVQKLINEQE
jgi:hypothetical protein